MLESCTIQELNSSAKITFAEEVVLSPTFTPEANTNTILFSSTKAWKAEVKESNTWCAISPSSGDAGENISVTISITANNTSDDRFATVTFKSEDVEQYIKVTQKKKSIKLLERITQPKAITGLANAASALSVVAALPAEIVLITDNGNVSGNITWETPADATYNPAIQTAQIFDVVGYVTLPDGVVNRNNISLSVTISVAVDAKDGVSGDDFIDGGTIS